MEDIRINSNGWVALAGIAIGGCTLMLAGWAEISRNYATVERVEGLEALRLESNKRLEEKIDSMTAHFDKQISRFDGVFTDHTQKLNDITSQLNDLNKLWGPEVWRLHRDRVKP
jgi:hypothetical protein